jgi:Lar family restriction alleviation protein
MKISPCPFCGSSNVGAYQKSFVQCRNCIATGPMADDEQEAIGLWNTRTGTVYNGKTAEEWCRLYADAVIRVKSLVDLAISSQEQPCPPPSEAP